MPVEKCELVILCQIKSGVFRNKVCCHWGVNFQFKQIEHIEAKSNFRYEPEKVLCGLHIVF